MNIFKKVQQKILKAMRREIKRQKREGQQWSGGGFENSAIMELNSHTNGIPLLLTVDGDPQSFTFSDTNGNVVSYENAYIIGIISKDFWDRWGDEFEIFLERYNIVIDVMPLYFDLKQFCNNENIPIPPRGVHSDEKYKPYYSLQTIVSTTDFWLHKTVSAGEDEVDLSSYFGKMTRKSIYELFSSMYYGFHVSSTDWERFHERQPDFFIVMNNLLKDFITKRM